MQSTQEVGFQKLCFSRRVYIHLLRGINDRPVRELCKSIKVLDHFYYYVI